MKYNWPKVVEAFRAEIVKHVVFKDKNGKVDQGWMEEFAYIMRATDTFHPWDSDGELSRALERMPQRCDYRSIKSYWAFKRGKEAILDALYSMCQDVGDIIHDRYDTAWNFAPGIKLPAAIEMPGWEKEVETMLPKILRAAKM